MVSLRPDERAALDDLLHFLRGRFGARLRGVRLFGSRARGEGHEGSDLDVLVEVAELDGRERMEVGAFTGDLLTAHRVIVGALALSSAEVANLRTLERRLIREIDRDGIDVLGEAPTAPPATDGARR
ncbi:MAG: nucleotidyltransferase domain-containing protein [Myxococcota bacterium]|nr:nucleotidyltransferase domain-containing protein [Myxococcota bacterium]